MMEYFCKIDGWCDWKKIEAFDMTTAAEKTAEKYDIETAEYPICGGKEDIIVLVRNDRAEKIRTFRVSGEMVPSYYAEEKEGNANLAGE